MPSFLLSLVVLPKSLLGLRQSAYFYRRYSNISSTLLPFSSNIGDLKVPRREDFSENQAFQAISSSWFVHCVLVWPHFLHNHICFMIIHDQPIKRLLKNIGCHVANTHFQYTLRYMDHHRNPLFLSLPASQVEAGLCSYTVSQYQLFSLFFCLVRFKSLNHAIMWSLLIYGNGCWSYNHQFRSLNHTIIWSLLIYGNGCWSLHHRLRSRITP